MRKVAERDGDGPVEIEIAVEAGNWPERSELEVLAKRCLTVACQTASADKGRACSGYTVSLLFTNDAAMRELNRTWRGRDKATNVLSFPQAGIATPVLGDIVLAWETIQREAALEEKPTNHHIAHLIVHGFLHLLGYDHQQREDAELMEHLERCGLKKIGIADPYAAAVTKDD